MFDYCIMVCLCSLWLLYLHTDALLFVVFFLVTEALFHCRVVAFAKLKNCREPSSVNEKSPPFDSVAEPGPLPNDVSGAASVAEPPLFWAAPAPDGQGPGADSGSSSDLLMDIGN